MSLLDWYLPEPTVACPVCGSVPEEWQGGNGPCALLVWQQGREEPIEQRVDDEVSMFESLRHSRLPDTFEFGGYDEAGHELRVTGRTVDGVWIESVLTRVTEFFKARSGEHFHRVLWGKPDDRRPWLRSDR